MKRYGYYVNKIDMRRFYQSDTTKRGYRKRMMKSQRKTRLFGIPKQKVADQNRVIRTNCSLSELELQ